MTEGEVVTRYGVIVGIGAGLVGGGLSGSWLVAIGVAMIAWAATPFLFVWLKRG